MRVNVDYEWAVEHTDSDGDIHDHDYAKTYSELIKNKRVIEGLASVIVLVRSEGSELEGVTDRAWAYLKDGKLPECFFNCFNQKMPNMKVPKKYTRQVK